MMIGERGRLEVKMVMMVIMRITKVKIIMVLMIVHCKGNRPLAANHWMHQIF